MDAVLDRLQADPGALSDILLSLTKHEKIELLELLELREQNKLMTERQTNFMAFTKHVWPTFIDGRHHQIMAEKFERIADGSLKRLIINMPPRHTKSEFASFLLPAWFLGKFPHKKIIQTSHTAELAVGFGRKVRNLVDDPAYRDVFPTIQLSADSKAAGRWNTNARGEYFAIGVGGAVAGKGADLLIIDDPHSEQEAVVAETNPEVYDKVLDWYMGGPRQRLQPGGAIVIVMTRWSKRDLTGRLVQKMVNHDGDEWEVIEFPAIMPSGNPLWPEFWPLDELLKVKAAIPVGKWNAQYMQDPTSEEGALIKREWWRRWEKPQPPHCEFIIQSWDTAFMAKERSDYSACTTWGVFYEDDEDTGLPKVGIILLDAVRGKWEFPQLKVKALETYKMWEPDSFIVEAKAAGAPLVFELRAQGIPVQEFTPSRGNDKIARVNAVADLFSSGVVYAPDHRWADEVIEECASFPAGEHDDYVDTVSQALLRFRRGGFIRLDSDEDDTDGATARLGDSKRFY